MTKDQSATIRVGQLCWSRTTGLGEPYPVTEIVNAGPRPPYFRLRGALLTYRDVTPNRHVKPSTPPDVLCERKRRREREKYRLEHAGCVGRKGATQ